MNVKFKVFWVCFVLWILCFELYFSCPFAFAADNDRIVAKANRKYKAERFDEAKELYRKAVGDSPDSPEYNFNLGTAEFKTEDFPGSANSFQKALVSEDKSLEARANYNMGNARYELGIQAKESNLQDAVKSLSESLEYYKRAIGLDQKDEDTKFNYEFVHRELELLKKQLEQQKQEQKEDKKQQEQKQEENSQEKEEKQQGKQQEGQKEKAKEEQQKQQKESESNIEETQGAGEGLSPKEAEMLLEGYKQDEVKEGELRDTRKGYPVEVLKDW